MNELRHIKRALISVFDKTNLAALAQFLVTHDVEIISTGKTASHLAEHGIKVTEITDLTHFPEILDGRVKTLNPRVFAGILFDRNRKNHHQTVNDLSIGAIDLVVVNLYPFETIANEAPLDEQRLIDNIDIGGPALLRAAAKNYESVTVMADPNQYDSFIKHYQDEGGTLLHFRRMCAQRVFARTSAYDNTIAATFGQSDDEKLLRYGENPHQQARVYAYDDGSTIGLASTPSLSGKELLVQ